MFSRKSTKECNTEEELSDQDREIQKQVEKILHKKLESSFDTLIKEEVWKPISKDDSGEDVESQVCIFSSAHREEKGEELQNRPAVNQEEEDESSDSEEEEERMRKIVGIAVSFPVPQSKQRCDENTQQCDEEQNKKRKRDETDQSPQKKPKREKGDENTQEQNKKEKKEKKEKKKKQKEKKKKEKKKDKTKKKQKKRKLLDE